MADHGSRAVDARQVMEDIFLSAGHDPIEAAEEGIKAEAVQWLAQQIKASGLTQVEFGARIGWPQSTVSALLRGNLEDYSLARVNKALAVFGARIVLHPELELPQAAE